MFRGLTLGGLLHLAFSCALLAGELSLPAVFSDHAVLQSGAATPVWGKAAAGAEVLVVLGDVRTTAKADGRANGWPSSI